MCFKAFGGFPHPSPISNLEAAVKLALKVGIEGEEPGNEVEAAVFHRLLKVR